MSLSLSSIVMGVPLNQTLMTGTYRQSGLQETKSVIVMIDDTEVYRGEVPVSKQWDVSVRLGITEKDK